MRTHWARSGRVQDQLLVSGTRTISRFLCVTATSWPNQIEGAS
jgi:hypothetical protein